MATAIDARKWEKAIAAWSGFLCDKYGVNPVFIHSDKDMGEIGAAQDVWEAKINLCWWHLRRAVRARLAKAKLATTSNEQWQNLHSSGPILSHLGREWT